MNLFIFHRDLRLIDNTSLIHQLKKYENTIPIFIFTKEQIEKSKNDYFSNNSVQFMIETLHELSETIKKYNGKLYFFKGDNIKILKAINKIDKINSISFNVDYTPYALKRDNEIKQFCEDENIELIMKEDYVLYDILEGNTKKENGEAYQVFTPFKNNCLKTLKVREIDRFRNFNFKKNKKFENISYYIDEKIIDEFYKENNDVIVRGGRENGLKILNNITKFKDYNKNRNYLTYETTHLSAYNHFTPISIREVFYKIKNKLGMKNDLINELHWRDFYVNITYFFPYVLEGQIKSKNKSFKKKYDNLKFKHNTKWFDAWKEGKTGIPIIDAGMRQLNKTGFMHNRLRMITCSFLYKSMHIDWRLGEKYFASKLIDYSVMQNNGGHQWCSSTGADAQPYFRIFNPWLQTIKFDKDYEFIKKWIPEIKNIPNNELNKWYDENIYKKYLNDGIDYYKPILDTSYETKITLKLYKI